MDIWILRFSWIIGYKGLVGSLYGYIQRFSMILLEKIILSLFRYQGSWLECLDTSGLVGNWNYSNSCLCWEYESWLGCLDTSRLVANWNNSYSFFCWEYGSWLRCLDTSGLVGNWNFTYSWLCWESEIETNFNLVCVGSMGVVWDA